MVLEKGNSSEMDENNKKRKTFENNNEVESKKTKTVERGMELVGIKENIESLTDEVDEKDAKENSKSTNINEMKEIIPEANEDPKDPQPNDEGSNAASNPGIEEMSGVLSFPHKRPKKRLNIDKNSDRTAKNKRFIYGNYANYYGYRNKRSPDERLELFRKYPEIFTGKEVLDIGCNVGFITMEIAKSFGVKYIHGLDIDSGLIKKAKNMLNRFKYKFPHVNPLKEQQQFPFNIKYHLGNYILKDDCLLEIEKARYDLILCLSVTKWMHLNWGDKGLKQAFKRMFLHLNRGGKLILEAQEFSSYRKRKQLTKEVYDNYKQIKFLPENFEEFLLSPEIGFNRVEVIGVPSNENKGFKRPIKMFFKD